MRTKFDIEQKIKELDTERRQLLKDYGNTNDENERSIIAERNMSYHEQIQQLKWVLMIWLRALNGLL